MKLKMEADRAVIHNFKKIFFGKMPAILKKYRFCLSEPLWIRMVKNLGWLVCKDCGFQLVEQSDNLGRNELTLKN